MPNVLDEVGHNKILIRESVLDVMSLLERIKNGDSSEAEKQVVYVDGERGVGKSTLMKLAMLYARKTGWLTMYMPSPRDWMVDKYALETGTGTAQAFLRSKITPDKLGQPLAAATIRQQVVTNHKDELAQLNQRRDYDHNLYNRKLSDGSVDSSLLTIVQRGQLVRNPKVFFSLMLIPGHGICIERSIRS